MANNITRWADEDPPNMLLAIDPGASFPDRNPHRRVPYAGVAMFQWGSLTWAGLVKCPIEVNTEVVSAFARPNALVKKVCHEVGIARFAGEAGRRGKPGVTLNVLAVENPLIYTKGTARPKDILALGKIYGAFMGGIDSEFYSGPSPQEWKGSIDPATVNERAAAILNPMEQVILIKAQRAGEGGLSDHVLDAVGLGLFTLARAGKAMVV